MYPNNLLRLFNYLSMVGIFYEQPLTQFSVVAFAPGKDFAIDGESHGVSSARMNRDLLDDELIERGKQLRSGDVVAMPKAQTTAGSFATSVHFTLVRHDEQTFAATFDRKE